MILIKQSRLSVSKVTAKEWDYIMGLVEEAIPSGAEEQDAEIVNADADAEQVVETNGEVDGEEGVEKDEMGQEEVNGEEFHDVEDAPAAKDVVDASPE
jgi:hypothetical protein